MAVHVPVDRQAVRGHRFFPQVEAEVLAPLLEHATLAPDILDHGTEAPITTRSDAFDERRLRVVPLEVDAAVSLRGVAQQPDLALELDDRVLPEPLERGERLRHESPD